MKLNHDCVRAVMLFLEENLDCISPVHISDIKLDKYSNEDTLYSVMKLNEAGYISADIRISISGSAMGLVKGITWDGHKFLDTVRDNKVWANTKSILSKVSSTSITFVSTVASQVLTNLISQSLSIAQTV